MSISSWKKEFYRVPASQVPGGQAAAHSLKKWLGLRPMSLRKHGVDLLQTDGGPVLDAARSKSSLAIDSDSCALCRQNRCCDGCPGQIANEDGCQGAYITARHGDVKPMIAWLRKAVAWEAAP